MAAFHGEALPTPLILLAISFSTALTGGVLYLCGRMKMGIWIRYVPYPVIGGFLASTGWTLVVGAVRVITSRPLTLGTLPELARPEILWHLIVGVVFAAILVGVMNRTKHFLALPGLLVFGTATLHVVRAALGVSVAQAQEQGWLLQVASGGRLWLPLRDISLAGFERSALTTGTLSHYVGGCSS